MGRSEAYHSLQNLKVICSSFFLASSSALDAGDDMMIISLKELKMPMMMSQEIGDSDFRG